MVDLHRSSLSQDKRVYNGGDTANSRTCMLRGSVISFVVLFVVSKVLFDQKFIRFLILLLLIIMTQLSVSAVIIIWQWLEDVCVLSSSWLHNYIDTRE